MSSTQKLTYIAGLYSTEVYADYQVANNCNPEAGNCSAELINQTSIHVPKGLNQQQTLDYIKSIDQGFISSDINILSMDCRYPYNDRISCIVTVDESITIKQVLIDQNKGLVQSISDAYDPADTFINIRSYVYANMHLDTNFGSFDLASDGWFPIQSLQPVASIDSLASRDIYISDTDITLNIELYETENAYTEMSANISIKGTIPELENSEILVFIDRLGLEDAKANAKLKYGDRSIKVHLNSENGFKNKIENNIKIANQDVEITVTADCIKNEDIDGFNIESCSNGSNFKGQVAVNDIKVADLEDRNGIPVFKFESGKNYNLIVTPNFLVQPEK